MKKLKFYGVWLVLIFILGMGFIGSGGGGGGNSSTSTKTSKITQTGYLADSGIEGLFYETSSGKTGITGKDGKYEFIEGDTVVFKLGNLQLGGAVTASKEPITPMKLYDINKTNYKNNTKSI